MDTNNSVNHPITCPKEYRFQDLTLGLTESFETEITQDMMKKFLEISGDCNPLHLDSEYAKSQGFKSEVVYGLLTSSFYSTLVGVYLPGKYALLEKVDVEFKLPAFVGDVLTVTGQIDYLNEAFQLAEIKAKITHQNGKVISKAKIRARVIERSAR